MIIDDIQITVAGGHGGKGSVAFQKNMLSKGPTGGSGGKGGSVILKGVSNLTALNQFRDRKERAAENGGDGRPQFRDGNDGKDLTLTVPVGTVVHNVDTDEQQEIVAVDELIVVARGGNGGKGNFLFRSSRNTTPKQSQPGLPGERVRLRLELKFIADVGLIGFPNVGKSSLLNALTNATSKVANYHFTTLEPHLGVYYGLILTDIPGLIKNASKGKGLGIKFLRHIERTKVLFHLISAESNSPVGDYRIIRKELGAHNKEILTKPEYVFLSKSDVVSKDALQKKITALKKVATITSVTPISIYDDDDLKKVEKILVALQKKIPKIQSTNK